jgi:hypothetical protein
MNTRFFSDANNSTNSNRTRLALFFVCANGNFRLIMPTVSCPTERVGVEGVVYIRFNNDGIRQITVPSIFSLFKTCNRTRASIPSSMLGNCKNEGERFFPPVSEWQDPC